MAPILDLCYFLALIVLSPYFLYKQITTGKYRMHMSRRMGFYPHRLTKGDADKKCLLIHGVSVGEILAAKPIVAEWKQRFPDWDIVLSVTTDTGWAVAEKTYPNLQRFRFPLDFSWAVKSFLTKTQPDAIVVMELELWPNFIRQAYARAIPLIVANGRISERSHSRYKTWRWAVAGMFQKVTQFLVQEDIYQERLLDLGVAAERIAVSGTVKYDSMDVNVDPDQRTHLRTIFGMKDDTVLLMAASTHELEEGYLLEMLRKLQPDFPSLRLLLVPRHPPRFDRVHKIIVDHDFGPKRKSELSALSEKPSASKFYCDPGTVILGDTMGEMGDYYAAADLVFVGGSLIEHGGQNMLEPAALGRATLFGPHVSNFEQPAKTLLAAQAAVQVAGHGDPLEEAIRSLLENSQERQRLATAARETVMQHRGASAFTVNRIMELIS